MNLVKPDSVTTTGSITRSTTGTYVDSAGVIQTAAINAVRINHDPTTKEFLGILIENASTNLLTYSDQFDNAAWTKSDVLVIANSILAPNGSISADKLLANTVTTSHYLYRQAVLNQGVTYVFSIYAKAQESSLISLWRSTTGGAFSDNRGVTFNILNGTIHGVTGDCFPVIEPAKVNLMDVAPNQIASIAASLIPFLEHDDANRALMGSNMQRQAVPTLRAEKPLVGTGMERTVAKDSGVTVVATRGGKIESVDAARIVVRVNDTETENGTSGVDIYNLIK